MRMSFQVFLKRLKKNLRKIFRKSYLKNKKAEIHSTVVTLGKDAARTARKMRPTRPFPRFYNSFPQMVFYQISP
jgi:hypothetical protein